jgi:type III pantothenate kinase
MPDNRYNNNMLLALDIGNSALKAGVFGRDGLRSGRFELVGLDLTPEVCVDMLDGFLSASGGRRPASAVIASVVPGATAVVSEAARAITGSEPLLLTHETACGLRFELEEPGALGADRIAAAVGAVESLGAPVAVVDFGTATTVGFVFEGETPEYAVFRGGAIMPGLGLMAGALSSATAQLPGVDFGRGFSALGRDTEENMLSGIVLGTAGAVERIVAEVEKTEGVGFQLALTGGMARLASESMLRPFALLEPDLTLFGLKAVHERNA